jgi:hypothetical protein
MLLGSRSRDLLREFTTKIVVIPIQSFHHVADAFGKHFLKLAFQLSDEPLHSLGVRRGLKLDCRSVVNGNARLDKLFLLFSRRSQPDLAFSHRRCSARAEKLYSTSSAR